jgi:chemotaxis methyl-accepting protein methylase
VTEFFRDPELFDYLKAEVLPELIEEAREEENQLRIWSAGCATGEEAYSLAILVSEALGQEAGLFNVRILATDIDEDAVKFARRGLYPPSALKGLSVRANKALLRRGGRLLPGKEADPGHDRVRGARPGPAFAFPQRRPGGKP